MSDQRPQQTPREPPPALMSDEVPTRTEMARIARALLRERATVDQQLAARMRELGIDLGRQKAR
jgi:hypothetical protein